MTIYPSHSTIIFNQLLRIFRSRKPYLRQDTLWYKSQARWLTTILRAKMRILLKYKQASGNIHPSQTPTFIARFTKVNLEIFRTESFATTVN